MAAPAAEEQKVQTDCRTNQFSLENLQSMPWQTSHAFTVKWMYSQCTTTERSAVKYNWIHPDEVQTPYKLDIFNFNIKQMLLPTMKRCNIFYLLISVNWSCLWWWSCQFCLRLISFFHNNHFRVTLDLVINISTLDPFGKPMHFSITQSHPVPPTTNLLVHNQCKTNINQSETTSCNFILKVSSQFIFLNYWIKCMSLVEYFHFHYQEPASMLF